MLDNHVTYVDCTEDAVIVVFNIDKILSMCTWCVCLLYRCCVCKVNVSCVYGDLCVPLCTWCVLCLVCVLCCLVHTWCVCVCVLCVRSECAFCVMVCVHGVCMVCVLCVQAEIIYRGIGSGGT